MLCLGVECMTGDEATEVAAAEISEIVLKDVIYRLIWMTVEWYGTSW